MCDRSTPRQRLAWPATAWLLAAAVLAGTARTAANADSPAAREVAGGLAALLDKLPATTQVGLVVKDLEDGSSWFEHGGDVPLKPASVMKLFVSAAALHRLGPEFCWETRLYVHDGELWVIGAGDPGLGDERIALRQGRAVDWVFDEWARALRAANVPALRNIVLDDSVFDQQWRHPDWPEEQSDAWYQAPVGGLNFNDNCLDVRVTPRGTTLELCLQPELPASFLRNELIRGRKHRPTASRRPDSDIFRISGTVARADSLGPVSARRPAVFFGYALKQALARRDVAVAGDVVRRTVPPGALSKAALVDVQRTALRDALWRCNTYSQNLFAECLLKSLAAYDHGGHRNGTPGSWEAGSAALRATLAELGVDVRGAVFRDGSGLSHQNRVTAGQIVALLASMHRHAHGDGFFESLAVAGEDGTMRRQYGEPALRGRIRGKTGTLAGVRTLAGYVTRPDGATLAFALLINGGTGGSLPLDVSRVLAGTASGLSAPPAAPARSP